jgi:putative ABC transport system permease protein
LLVAGAHLQVATLSAVAGCALAGGVAALIHLRFRINALLAGILVMTILHSVNLRVPGKANVALLSNETLLSLISPQLHVNVGQQLIAAAPAMAMVLAGLFWFLRTEAGLSLRAVGSNPELAPALAIHPWAWVIAGLGLGNALAGLAGAVVVQMQGFADVQMGFGVLITGLAALIIGETLIGRASVARQLIAPVLGAVVYYQLVSLGLAAGLKPADLKLATGLFVLVTLALPALRQGTAHERFRE